MSEREHPRRSFARKERSSFSFSFSLIAAFALGYLWLYRNGRRISDILITDIATLQGFLSYTRVCCRIIFMASRINQSSRRARTTDLLRIPFVCSVRRSAMYGNLQYFGQISFFQIVTRYSIYVRSWRAQKGEFAVENSIERTHSASSSFRNILRTCILYIP